MTRPAAPPRALPAETPTPNPHQKEKPMLRRLALAIIEAMFQILAAFPAGTGKAMPRWVARQRLLPVLERFLVRWYHLTARKSRQIENLRAVDQMQSDHKPL
jgi:hypothetical protein